MTLKLLRLVYSSHWLYDAATVVTGLFYSPTVWRWNCCDWPILVTDCMTLKLLRLVYSSHWLFGADTAETGPFLSLTVRNWHCQDRYTCHWLRDLQNVMSVSILITDCKKLKLIVGPFSSLTARLILRPLKLVHTETVKTATHLSLTAHY